MTEKGAVLGIDPGRKRIGLAISDPARRMALPLEVIRRTADGSHLKHIADLVAERGVGEIVVGLPISLDGSEGPSAEAARNLAGDIAETAGVPVVFVDERLTTVSATRRLREAGATKTKGMVDSLAAAELLQLHLDAPR